MRASRWAPFSWMTMDNKFRTLIVGLVLAGLAVLYLILGQVTGAPHYDARFDTVVLPTGPKGQASKVAAVTAAMLRDGVARGWCPSESVLTPASWRTDTCAFQLG